jgi:hypothetical protein
MATWRNIMKNRQDVPLQIIFRNFVIELIVYGILVVIYFLLVVGLLGEPLLKLFNNNLTAFAFVSLGLIAGQAIILDFAIEFIIDILGLSRLT